MNRIPESALKKHIAILGMNGSGKTSVAKSEVIEPALAAGMRVCNIDPTGVGWGLRLKADGKTKGFSIYIVGGDHADFPLVRRDGKAWGEIVATSSDSFVFDTSQLTVEDRSQWFTDFAEVLLRKNKGPLHFVLDEAHLFAPQAGAKSGGVAPRMLHATNNLLALGRSKGLRITMISQRAAKLHKDALTQAHTLIAMMMTSPQDRGAVEDWIKDQADSGRGREIIASLPSLKPGEGWIWAPAEHLLEKVRFARPKTFDSSSAPDDAAGEGPKLSPINPDAVKAMLEKVAKETVANDPTKLRAEIAALKALNNELASKTVNDPADIKAAFEDGFRKGIADERQAIMNALSPHIQSLGHMWESFLQFDKPIKIPETGPATAKHSPVGAQRREPARVKPSPVPGSDGAISRSEQKIVDAIRWWNVLGIAAPSHAQVAFAAGYSHKSGTWATYLSRLRSAGLIEGRGDLVLTESGRASANEPISPPTPEALRGFVIDKIDAPLRRIMQPIMVAYPSGLSHADVAGEAGYSHTSGTWATYLSRLRSLDLIEGRGELKAQEWLFP